MANFECIKPVESAWDGMVARLFKPFDFKTWLKLGLLAWLAFMLEGGGISPLNFTNVFSKSPQSQTAGSAAKCDLPQWLTHPSSSQVVAIVCIVAGALIIGLLVGLLVLWVKSRGRFMFIDGLVRGTGVPFMERWRQAAPLGNSFFLFQLFWVFLSLIVILPLLALFGFFTVNAILLFADPKALTKIPFFFADGFGWLIAGAIASCLVFSVATIALAILQKLLFDFGSLHMYKNGTGAFKAASRVLRLIKEQPFGMFLYVVCSICVAIATGAVVLAFVLATCPLCCAGILLLSIPYVWAVTLLPALAFKQLFALEFAKQAGEEFDVMSQARDTVQPEA